MGGVYLCADDVQSCPPILCKCFQGKPTARRDLSETSKAGAGAPKGKVTMPITKEQKKLYPKNWRAISAQVRSEAGQRCETCGAKNHAWIYRDPDGTPHEADGFYLDQLVAEGVKVTRIILTVAHLDHNPRNSRRENLKALCQRCHLRLDQKQHRVNSARTRLRKKIERGQLALTVSGDTLQEKYA